MSPAATGCGNALSGADAERRLSSSSMILDDLVVATLDGERERSGRGAMWPDAFSRVGAMLHQEADDFRPPLQHGMVKRPMLVVLRDVQIHELWAGRHHRPHGVEIAVTHGLDEPTNRHAVDKCLQLGPAVKAVGARHDELRVMEGEGRRVGLAIVGVHFLRRFRISSAKGVEQFLGLPLELIEIGAVAKRTGRRRVAGHDELLFRLRQASAEGPVSAHSGRKEFISVLNSGNPYQSGRSPSRGHGGALIAPREA